MSDSPKMDMSSSNSLHYEFNIFTTFHLSIHLQALPRSFGSKPVKMVPSWDAKLAAIGPSKNLFVDGKSKSRRHLLVVRHPAPW